jgi:uncharacterized protein with PQ loop repeat
MIHPLHDIRARKNRRNKKQKHSHSRTELFDKAIILLGVVNIIATLPQVIQIWASQDAGGISLISWGYYSFFAAMLLIYGILHRDKPIIVNYTGGTILFSLVWLGAFIYQ